MKYISTTFGFSFTLLAIFSSAADAAISIDPAQEAIVQYTGTSSIQKVGEAHAGLGDVNGDGYDDMAIQVTVPGSRLGVLIVYGQAGQLAGGTGFESLPNTTLYTSNSSTAFGGTIAGVGDVNNDGYADILVGASRYSYTVGTTGGGAYLIYGKPALTGGSMSTTTDTYIVFASPYHNSYTGQSLAAVGDVNNDGNNDFLIGSPSYQTFQGAAYLVYGKAFSDYSSTNHVALLNNVNGEKMFVGTGSEQFGSVLAGTGDVDNDGCNDLLMSAPYARVDGASTRGAAYLVYGGNNGTCDGTTPSNYSYTIDLYTSEPFVAKFSGTAERTYTGVRTSGNGDVNGDGISDFSIGAFVYLGRNGSRYTSEYVGTTGHALGNTTVFDPQIKSMSGDLNHDGYSDMLWFDHRSGENVDEITVVYGQSNIDTINVNNSGIRFEYSGAEGYDSLATFVGDLNNDGDDDFMVSDGQARPPFNDGYGWASIIYSVMNSPTLTGPNSLTAECGVAFADPGATAIDAYSGETLSASASSLNTAVSGTVVREYTITNYLQRTSASVQRSITVSDTSSPTITLNGSSLIELPFGNNYTEPGASAIDACEGSKTVTATGSVNSTTAGDYTITYSATDSLGHTQQVYRTVRILPEVTTPATSTPEPETTEEPLTDEELAELDVRDEATRDELIDSIETGDDGDITVHLTNGQDIHIEVSADDTGEGMLVELLSDTGAILVVTPKGKYVKLINPYTGEILDSHRLSKKGWKEKNLKLKDLREDGLTDVIVTTKKSPTSQLGIVRLNKPRLAFTKKAKVALDSSSIQVQKTKVKANVLKLRNKKGAAIAEYKLTKLYKLKLLTLE